MTELREKYEDRLIDAALREHLGGKGPPDFGEVVTLARPKRRSENVAPRRAWPKFAAAAALLAALAGLAYLPGADRGGDVAIPSGARAPGLVDDSASIGHDFYALATKQLPSVPIRPGHYAQIGEIREQVISRRERELNKSLGENPYQQVWSGVDDSSRYLFAGLDAPPGYIDLPPEATYLPPPGDGRGPDRPGDRYAGIIENPFRGAMVHPLSTFSIDVDTAAYSKIRSLLLAHNTVPPPDAVRIEELVNYFAYDYAGPKGDAPFTVHPEVAACPWQPKHRLVRIGIQGRKIEADQQPAANLVFLIDVSGSMEESNKLPLVKQGLKLLTQQLREQDRVAIVTYAGNSGLVLPSTPGTQKEKITEVIADLSPGGSTNGEAGIDLAYQIAADHFIKHGVNRVILCTDGDFNVGVTGTGGLERLVEEKAKTGVFLTALGFGLGNHNDAMLESVSNKGNGNYAYIDSPLEARKVFETQLTGTLVTIAKDVKIQVEFNPAKVAAYRLIGYENRMLATEDFNDDRKDAGEIGAGHRVTALYEIVPAGEKITTPKVDDLEFQRPAALTDAAKKSGQLLLLKLRYKDPDGEKSKLIKQPVSDTGAEFAAASREFKFAASVAQFGLLLRGSRYQSDATMAAVLEVAGANVGPDPHGYRKEFLQIVEAARKLTGR